MHIALTMCSDERSISCVCLEHSTIHHRSHNCSLPSRRKIITIIGWRAFIHCTHPRNAPALLLMHHLCSCHSCTEWFFDLGCSNFSSASSNAPQRIQIIFNSNAQPLKRSQRTHLMHTLTWARSSHPVQFALHRWRRFTLFVRPLCVRTPPTLSSMFADEIEINHHVFIPSSATLAVVTGVWVWNAPVCSRAPGCASVRWPGSPVYLYGFCWIKINRSEEKILISYLCLPN